ncbi:hypothetical protein PG988_003884 [Apiospora saccharicola]
MIGAVIGTAVGAAIAPVLVGPALGVIGFSAIGPVAGSIAATAQSAGVVGATFSTLQSAAMGGYGLAAVSTAFTGTGAVFGAGVGSILDEGEDQSEDTK